MKKLILLAALAVALTGCNTVAGVGEDVSGGARTIQSWFCTGPRPEQSKQEKGLSSCPVEAQCRDGRGRLAPGRRLR